MEVYVPQVYLLGKTYLTNNEKFYIRNDSIVHMAVGDRHSIIVTRSGRVYAFGDNNSGQLGLGHVNAVERVSCIKSLKFNRTGEKIVLAACGRDSSLVATSSGSLYAFGLNDHCQLGMQSEEAITSHPSPMKIDSFRSKMSWKQLAMGAEHTCALTNDGQVYVWGFNEVGQCGLDCTYRMITVPRQLRLEYSVKKISCGYYHTALISDDGRLFLFGNNSDQQLGRSKPDQCKGHLEVSLPDLVQDVACGARHTVVLTVKGDVYTCGRGDQGQLGLGRRVSLAKHFQMIENLPNHLTLIAAGATHTAIVDSRGQIYLFGDSTHGKLNYRTSANKFKPYLLDQFKGYNVLKVVCGGCQTIILAQGTSSENSNTKPTKNIARINRTDSIDETSKKKSFSFRAESTSNPDEMSTSIQRPLIKTTRDEMNKKLQSKNFSTNNETLQSLTTDVADHRPSFNKTTAALTISNHRFLSVNKSSACQPRSDQLNSLKKKLTSDDERSLSEIRSMPVSDESTEKKSSVNHDGCRTSSSTNSGRTSSSISSLLDDNSVENPGYDDALEHSSHSSECETHANPYKINSTDTSITTQSESGLFSRILNEKSSIITHTNSKTCSMM